MKILFFILGSIKERISNWGLANMSELLSQDLIFFGPIKEKEFYYNQKKIPIISFDEQLSIFDIFDKLPDKWYPDIVSCDTPIINFIPDIYKCPVKTYLHGRDGWGDIAYNRDICEMFDFLQYGIIDRRRYKNNKINLLPLKGMPVSISQIKNPTAFEKRNIDVVSIANYNEGFYHDRYRIMYLVAKQLNGLNIKYLRNLKRKQIHRYYQRSKIVLDWAHTLSNRSYEAALNGCLLFSQEDNYLIKEFWEPWEEYIPYNEDNVSDLIIQYLNNPEESQRVINNMRSKFNNIPKTFGGTFVNDYKQALNIEINVSDRIHRIEKWSKTKFNHCISTSFYYNYHYNFNKPNNWKELYFNTINNGLKNCDNNKEEKIKIIIEAFRMAFILNDFKKTRFYSSKLKHLLPEYPWVHYVEAYFLYKDGIFKDAKQKIKETLNLLAYNKELLTQYFLPFVQKGNLCDERRVVAYLWGDKDNKYDSYLKYNLLKLQGDILVKERKIEKALKSYEEAAKTLRLPEIGYLLCKHKIIIHKELINLKLLNNLLEENPYDSNLKVCLFISLLYKNQKNKAISLFYKHTKTLNVFKRNKKLRLYQLLSLIIIACSLAGKKFALLCYNKINKFVLSKNTFDY